MTGLDAGQISMTHPTHPTPLYHANDVKFHWHDPALPPLHSWTLIFPNYFPV